MKPHKDLPSGSQPWANEVDQLMAKVKELEGVVRRLTQNAGLDYSNPQRGINAGTAPSVQNPVGQKLSSLADVATYNVADGQYLSWSQQGQKWMPVTPASAGGTIDVSAISYSHQDQGYGKITDASNYAYTAATTDPTYGGEAEMWGSRTTTIGAGIYASDDYTYIEQVHAGSQGAYTAIETVNPNASGARLVVNANSVFLQYAPFRIESFGTTVRPTVSTSGDQGSSIWDFDLKLPIWWNGTTWVNALGTAV